MLFELVLATFTTSLGITKSALIKECANVLGMFYCSRLESYTESIPLLILSKKRLVELVAPYTVFLKKDLIPLASPLSVGCPEKVSRSITPCLKCLKSSLGFPKASEEVRMYRAWFLH